MSLSIPCNTQQCFYDDKNHIINMIKYSIHHPVHTPPTFLVLIDKNQVCCCCRVSLGQGCAGSSETPSVAPTRPHQAFPSSPVFGCSKPASGTHHNAAMHLTYSLWYLTGVSGWPRDLKRFSSSFHQHAINPVWCDVKLLYRGSWAFGGAKVHHSLSGNGAMFHLPQPLDIPGQKSE